MRVWLPIVVLVFATLLPAQSSAQDLAARVTPQGLSTLSEVALARVPTVFPIERLDPVLFDCPGDDIVAHIPETDVNLNFRELDLQTDDGRIIFSTTLDIAVANTIQLDNPNACLGSALCDVSANIDRLGIVIELAAGTSRDGGVEFHSASAQISITADDLALESVGCALGDVATWLFDAFEEWALNLLTPRLEAAISERLSMALTQLFSETVGLTVEREGFSIEGWLDTLDLTRLHGITLGGGADITWMGPAIYEDPAPAALEPTAVALPQDTLGDFQIAITDRLVNDALYEAWRGGLMRRLLADQSLSVDLAGGGAASLIGLNDGAQLDVSFDIERPLVASFGRLGPNVAEMAMDGLRVTIDVTPVSGPASSITIRASATMAMAITVDPEVGGMVMDLEDMRLGSISIETEGEDLVLDGARLDRLVSGTVAPMLAGRLSGLPVAPGLHPVMGTFVHVRTVESDGGWQRVGIDLVLPNPDDVVPPDTMLVDPATLMAAGTAAFNVTGTDDDTPTPLLRYRAWLDGTPLDEGNASSLRSVRFDVTGGEHTLEVAAVDLNDNVDGTPVAHVFEVDGTPPELNVQSSPPAVISGGDVSATWMATDAEGPVESRWLLRLVGDDGLATIVQESVFATETNSVQLAVSTLMPSNLYELEIVARDAAGNVTSQRFGFALQGSTGCSASASRRGTPPVFLGSLLVGLFVLRSTRRS